MTNFSDYNPRVDRGGFRGNRSNSSSYRNDLSEEELRSVYSTIMVCFIGAILVLCLLCSMAHALRRQIDDDNDDTFANDDDASKKKNKPTREYDYRRVTLRKEHFHQRPPLSQQQSAVGRTSRIDDDTATSSSSDVVQRISRTQKGSTTTISFVPDTQSADVESSLKKQKKRLSGDDNDTPSVCTNETDDDCYDWDEDDNVATEQQRNHSNHPQEVFTLRFGKHTKEFQNVCAICLGSYEVGETVVWSTNPTCNHAYHEECVQPIFERGRTKCPLCRADFVDLEDGVA